QQVERALLLARDVEQIGQQRCQGQQEEGRGEHGEQPIAGPPPEAHEEHRGDRIAHHLGPAEEADVGPAGHHWTSQIKPYSSTPTAAKPDSWRGQVRSAEVSSTMSSTTNRLFRASRLKQIALHISRALRVRRYERTSRAAQAMLVSRHSR